MKHTAEEVREAARITDGMIGLRKLSDMLTAYAERIEADKEVEPTEAVLNKAVEVFLSVAPEWDDYLVKDGMRAALLDVWPNPPAQPAERVVEGWKLGMAVLQSDLYRKLSEEDRAICDALVASNPHIHAAQQADRAEPCNRNCDCVGPCKMGADR